MYNSILGIGVLVNTPIPSEMRKNGSYNMNYKHCSDCRYYLQHYTFNDNERKLFRVYCGHCTFSKVKRKQPDAMACENFVSGSVQEDAFVSKEYLSKALLQYILDLELLPEIEDKG